MKWIDISDVLTEEGKTKVKAGQVLMFTKVHLKIKRKAANGKIWAERTFMYRPEEVDIVEKT